MKIQALTLALPLALMASLLGTPQAATAAENLPYVSSKIDLADGAYAVQNGDFHPVDFSASTLSLEGPLQGKEGLISPNLIDFGQWTRCFIGNNPNDVFDKYFDWGGLREVQLRCGTGNKDNGWGYKHIRDGHERDWQAQLDQITPYGLAPNASWDDIMSVANDSNIQFPSYTGGSGNTKCVVGQTAFVSKGVVVQVINSKTVWNRTDGRIITSLPIRNQTCR